MTLLRDGTASLVIFCKAFTKARLSDGAESAAAIEISRRHHVKKIKNAMPPRQKVVGIPWFKAESYDACRAMMSDGVGLPQQYNDWLMHAEALRREAEGAGHHVLKVDIEPKDFFAWCRARNITPDAKARVRFANFVAFREAGYISGNPGRVPKGSLSRI